MVGTGGELHWSWGKKLRHINELLPLPCGTFIGGGYDFQEAEQRGGSKALIIPVFAPGNTSAYATRVPQPAAKICNATCEQN
jgi:hypothetical protein